MREKTLEHNLVMGVKRVGGLALKFVSPGFAGIPDRLVLLRGGKLGFVEVKAPGEHTRPLQETRLRLLRDMGFKTFVLDGAEQIEKILREIGGDAK